MLRPDSRLIRFLTKVCDLLFLNLMLVFCCCTVILSGSAVIALCSIALKMVRGEDYDTVKGFFRALRENFLASTPVAVLLLGTWLSWLLCAVCSTPRRCSCPPPCSSCCVSWPCS